MNTLLPNCIFSLAHIFTSILFTVSLWRMDDGYYDAEKVVAVVFIVAPLTANIITVHWIIRKESRRNSVRSF